MIPLPPNLGVGPGPVDERLASVGREKTLKAIAALIMLGGASGIASSLLALCAVVARGGPGVGSWLIWVILEMVLSVVMVALAVRLWSLRWLGLLALAIGSFNCLSGALMLAMPDGGDDVDGPSRAYLIVPVVLQGFLGLYLGYLAISPKSRRVVSAAYRDGVMNQTPQIENRLATSTVACLALIGLLVLVGLVSTILALMNGEVVG